MGNEEIPNFLSNILNASQKKRLNKYKFTLLSRYL
jgi:hypothetical protein